VTPRVPRTASRVRASLDADGFEKLLARLDPDRERAGAEYEVIRSKLVKFFRWRGWPRPEELVDETIDRVCRRLAEGEVIRQRDPFPYFHGVARNVLREAWQTREPKKTRHPPAGIDFPRSANDRAALDGVDEAAEFEARLGCLERCLENLDAAEQELIVRYYRGQGTELLERRRRMAEEMGIPLNALRIRACRVRLRLAACVEAALRRTSGERDH
jgi:DNA-directed RNA polymerase specialized sigma24 family protein